MRKALLFSGTSDGSRLALCLAGRGWLVTVCTATEYGERSAPAMSTSGFMPGAWTGGRWRPSWRRIRLNW